MYIEQEETVEELTEVQELRLQLLANFNECPHRTTETLEIVETDKNTDGCLHLTYTTADGSKTFWLTVDGIHLNANFLEPVAYNSQLIAEDDYRTADRWTENAVAIMVDYQLLKPELSLRDGVILSHVMGFNPGQARLYELVRFICSDYKAQNFYEAKCDFLYASSVFDYHVKYTPVEVISEVDALVTSAN